MKDMSEEKELQDAVKDICDKPRDYLERWVLAHLKEFHRVDALAKSLESRLKEAEQYSNGYRKACNNLNKRLEVADFEMKSLEHRLSQAEATIHWVTAGEARKEILSIEARLSHLMDVAGKMAEALELTRKHIEDRLWEGEGDYSQEVEIVDKAKLALAEWDGIKSKEGV